MQYNFELVELIIVNVVFIQTEINKKVNNSLMVVQKPQTLLILK